MASAAAMMGEYARPHSETSALRIKSGGSRTTAANGPCERGADRAPSAQRARIPVRVISGGQSGVDRAALDAAIAAGLATGGWCPRGRRAEDGPISRRYPLRETPTRAYSQRTEWNVRDSDATLILYRGALLGGTRLTAALAMRYGRPRLILDLDTRPDPLIAREWIAAQGVRVLNVAGPRQADAPGIYAQARSFLLTVLQSLDRANALRSQVPSERES